MKFTTVLASVAALVATAQAADETKSVMTLEYPGFTQTIPVGLDISSTQTITGWTVSGTAIIYSGVAVLTDSTAVYMEELSNTGNNVKGGIGPQNTNIVGDVTVVGGTIQGLKSATATESSPSSPSSSSSSASTTAPGASTTPDSGAARFGGGKGLAIAGLGVAIAAVAV